MTAPAIVVEEVTKRFRRPLEQMHTFKVRALHPFRRATFDEFEAVRDVSFAIDRGEFFGIVGRNGSGKSTLLKLMAGIYRANGGEIWMNGRLSTFIELGVGFNPDLAARDNVILNGIMLGLSPSEARARYEHVIDFAELREFESVKLKNYSSGMHVRLAFAVMIQVDADILLVDEVLAVGDAAFQQKCFDEFNRLRDAGKTIVLVTHDMGAVRRFAHRAMLLERGQIVSIGDPDTVGSQYLDMNFAHEQRPKSPDEPAPVRFGDGRVRFTDIWIENASGEAVQSVRHGEEITIRANIEFREATEHPSLEISIDSDQHRRLFVANSYWRSERLDRTGVFAAGDHASLSVRFLNPLGPGRYYLSPAVAQRGGGLEPFDFVPRMGTFMTSGAPTTGAAIELDYDMALTPGRSIPLVEAAPS
jgi:ABC-type polysaccharide/polyol phosphate transport system ATPase subunit